MVDQRKAHRVIGIRHTIKAFKEVGLVDDTVMYSKDAVADVQSAMMDVAQSGYEIGAKKGARLMLEAILDERLKVTKNGNGEIEILSMVHSFG